MTQMELPINELSCIDLTAWEVREPFSGYDACELPTFLRAAV